jgi:glucose-specific phosphotransferase system IIA component
MFRLFKHEEEFVSPVGGIQIPIEEVPDPVFSKKMMGEGYAIKPEGDTIYAPISGSIEVLMNTNHAIGIKGKDGKEVLLHIGVDSVNLNGEGFKSMVKKNQKVKQGDPLMKVDFDLLRKKVISDVVIVLLPNASKVLPLYKNAHIDVKQTETVKIEY